MAVNENNLKITRWAGGQHPTLTSIVDQIKQEGLRPYTWKNAPNHRFAVRSHGYDKILYVIQGMLEITLPDFNERVLLRSGDRLEIPAGTRHGANVGHSGVQCVEVAVRRAQR